MTATFHVALSTLFNNKVFVFPHVLHPFKTEEMPIISTNYPNNTARKRVLRRGCSWVQAWWRRGAVHLPEKRNRFDQPLRILLMSPVSEEV